MATKYSNVLLQAVGATNEAEFDAKLAELLASNSAEIAALQINLHAATESIGALKVELAKSKDEIAVLQSRTAGILTETQVKDLATEAGNTAGRKGATEVLGATGNSPLIKAGNPEAPSTPTTFEAAVKAQPEYATNKFAAIAKAKAAFPDLWESDLKRGGTARY